MTRDEVDWRALAMQPVPAVCQRDGCTSPVETWCVLCEQFLCATHDELAPKRMHTCLGGPADD
ncbi:MAG TPA: hypothetical protein VFB50_00400 [Chloroflexota bacterium]|nr:hypothetical protein [Chloroflexota bacterium]